MSRSKFDEVVDLYECLDILEKRKKDRNRLVMEYDVKNTTVNRKFLKFQVEVILEFFKKYIKDKSVKASDEEAVFMFMYQNTNIMKVFRDEYGDITDEAVEAWTSKDIPTVLKELKPKVKIK